MNKTTSSILVAAILVAGAIVFSAGLSENTGGKNTIPADNVSLVDGKQIVNIFAKGGYSPRTSIAKADMLTIIRVTTQGTFDCSIALVIPALKYRQNLQPNDSVDIDIPPQKAGTSIQGICAMGMYNFKVNFE